MLNEIPQSRQRIHRATRLPAGPPTPISKADWPYKLPPSAQIIWRYLDFWKFESMLSTSSLYFCRDDKFDDPLEGRLSKRGVHGTSASDIPHASAYPVTEDYDSQVASQEITRRCMFVNCWHMNTHESDRMWKKYTTSTDSVVVASSVKALQRMLPSGEVMMSAVKYVPEDFPRTEFDNLSILFYKDESFRYERELRLLRPLRRGETVKFDSEEDFRRFIPVNLRLLVHRVILNKAVSDTARQHVAKLVRQHCTRASIHESGL